MDGPAGAGVRSGAHDVAPLQREGVFNVADQRRGAEGAADHLHDIEPEIGWRRAQPAQVADCGTAEGVAFAAVHGCPGTPEGLGAPRFDLHEDQGLAVPGDQVEFVADAQADAAAEEAVALLFEMSGGLGFAPEAGQQVEGKGHGGSGSRARGAVRF